MVIAMNRGIDVAGWAVCVAIALACVMFGPGCTHIVKTETGLTYWSILNSVQADGEVTS